MPKNHSNLFITPDEYYASILWNENSPRSKTFDDIYYDKSSGIEESKYVFLKHNNLEKMFQELNDNDCFVIGETGFGSGLNFIATKMLWKEVVKSKAKLFYISFEKFPLNPEDLKKILGNFPDLDTSELVEQYILPLPATHRLNFENNIYLNLVVGDINDTLSKQNFIADAWFFDGFTPTKNQDMWSNDLLEKIAKKSKDGTTFATFTSNSEVRRNLLDNKFMVNKAKGFSKREMLYGIYIAEQFNTYTKPWFAIPNKIDIEREISIIGGGISGAATAYSLALRGHKVTLYEKNPELAMEASGNYQAMLYGNFSGNYNPLLELSLSGYRYSLNLIVRLLSEGYKKCGLFQILKNEQQQNLILKNRFPNDFCYPVSQKDIEIICGVKNNATHGIFFPHGIWLNPKTLINKLVSHPNIKIQFNCNIEKIYFDYDKWILHTTKNEVANSKILVLCNSHRLADFIPSTNNFINKTRGQTTKIKGSIGLKSILCGNGYITPNWRDHFTIGATYKEVDDELCVKLNEHIENIDQIQEIIPILKGLIKIDELEGNVNIRSHSKDHLPLVGPIADFEAFNQTYASLSKDAKYKLTTPCPYLPGLYVNTLFGSKGMLFAPLCGEIIADYIDNTPFPGSELLRQALHPNRFWLKKIIKSNLAKENK